MDARKTRSLLAAAILVASGSTAACSRPTAPPVAQAQDAQGDADASASASADAGASADADADAGASADADADADAGASADAGAAASADAGAAEGGATRSRLVRIDEASAGKTIELAPGQSLVLMLTANPSTGFDWAVIKAPAALGAPDMGFVAGGEQPGAPGKRRITWTVKSALLAGDQAVELGYARSFETGVAPFKTFKFKVRGSH